MHRQWHPCILVVSEICTLEYFFLAFLRFIFVNLFLSVALRYSNFFRFLSIFERVCTICVSRAPLLVWEDHGFTKPRCNATRVRSCTEVVLQSSITAVQLAERPLAQQDPGDPLEANVLEIRTCSFRIAVLAGFKRWGVWFWWWKLWLGKPLFSLSFQIRREFWISDTQLNWTYVKCDECSRSVHGHS